MAPYRERIPTALGIPFPLGRHINHDPESRRYAYPETDRVLQSVRWPRRTPVLDQGNLGSCTGNAGIGCLGTDPFYATVGADDQYHRLNEADAVALYSAATVADDNPGQYPPDDTGSDGLTIAKVLTASGEISGYQHAFSLTAALSALQAGPVITGVNWYNDMFNPASNGLIDITGDLAGGHEFVVDEYDATNGTVGFTNSWGAGWGLNGRAYLRLADWATLLGRQGDVTVFVPSTQPAPVPTPPGPAPTPGPDRADATLVLDLGHWPNDPHIGANKRAAAAIRRWKVAKGL